MDDPALVRRLQPLGDLEEQRNRFVHRDRPSRDPLREVFALHQLHDQEPCVAVGLKSMNGRNVRMVQGGERLRLALEPSQPLLVFGERFRQHLDRHLTLELRVARPIHLSHAARTERAKDLVVA